MKPRALITGMSGFVGSHLAEYLLANTDWEIWGMIRWSDSLENIQSLIPEINGDGRVKLAYADLKDYSSLYSLTKDVRPDYVFHLAAQSFPKTSFTIATDTIDTNVNGTIRLLDAIRENCREALVHVCSSSEVYGRVKLEDLPITEECPMSPASPYSISKVGTDQIAQLYAEAYRLRIMTTRMFTHTGARRGDVFAESSFAKQIAMIEAGLMDPPIMVGNLASRRTVADVRDAVRAYYLLLTKEPIPGEVYNIGGAHVCTVGDILNKLLEVSSNDYDYVVDETRLRPVDADLQIPDCSKFIDHTGWQPEISFEETMQWLLDYWRERVETGSYLIR